MNQSLFRSLYALVAILAIAIWIGLWLKGQGELGIVGATGRNARLFTGAAALGCMLLAIAYVLRKYMHKYGYSPEFRLRVPISKLERCETRLSELRREILKGQHASRRGVQSLVQRILREEGVHRVLVVEVQAGPDSGPRFELRVAKAFVFGRTAKWLHVHLYISVAMAAMVFIHGADGWGTAFGATLLVTSAIVVVSGIVGIFLWAFGPSWLTRRERDLSIEEAFVLREGFRRKLAELLQQLDADLRRAFESACASGADEKQRVAALLKSMPAADAARRIQIQDALVLRGQLQRVEAEFRALWRIRLGFMAWRTLHLPAALILSLAVAAHVVSIVVY